MDLRQMRRPLKDRYREQTLTSPPEIQASWSSERSAARRELGLARQSEHALADDVALDLGRPASDGQRR